MEQVIQHPWNLSPKDAIKLQERLREYILLKNGFDKIDKVAGADVAFKEGNAYGVVMLFRYPSLELVEERVTVRKITYPYIPGLLTFREAPVLLDALLKLREEPDIIIFDGQGIAHPRSMGLATHIGVLIRKPTIGCAKSRLIGEYTQPGIKKGEMSELTFKGNIIGTVLRTRDKVKPLFISQGNLIDFSTSVRVILKCSRGYRLPEPTRLADIRTKQVKKLDF
jgi:deoxyribonuclease V